MFMKIHFKPGVLLLLSALLLFGSVLGVSDSRVSSWVSQLRADFVGRRTNSPNVRDTAPTRHLPGSSAPAFLTPSPVIDAPSNLSVSVTSNTLVRLTWVAPTGTVTQYRIERSQNLFGPFSLVGTATNTTFDDTTVTSINSYLYRVRAVDTFGAPSAPSNMAVGTAITFLDPELEASVTVVKADHVYQLRQAVNSMRSLAGLSAASWTNSNLNNAIIFAVDVEELRDKLAPALSALSVPASAYEDSDLVVATTFIKKVHIEQLRQRSTRSSSTSSGPADQGVDSANARLDPLNRTGGAGEDPLSRNFNWSLPLVGLSGRAGLDLGLSLSYNSLVWTKSGSYISFNDDGGFPAPGFRLGFPVIKRRFSIPK